MEVREEAVVPFHYRSITREVCLSIS